GRGCRPAVVSRSARDGRTPRGGRRPAGQRRGPDGGWIAGAGSSRRGPSSPGQRGKAMSAAKRLQRVRRWAVLVGLASLATLGMLAAIYPLGRYWGPFGGGEFEVRSPGVRIYLFEEHFLAAAELVAAGKELPRETDGTWLPLRPGARYSVTA